MGETWLENNQRFRQSQKFEFYRNAMDFIVGSHIAGSYFEFGTHRARTFTMVMVLDYFYAKNMGATKVIFTITLGIKYANKSVYLADSAGKKLATIKLSKSGFGSKTIAVNKAKVKVVELKMGSKKLANVNVQ
jgi:hypothetical protein